MGGRPPKVAWSIALPSSVPQLLGATRVALPLAFATEIYAELREPTTGLGVLLGNFTYSTSAAQTVSVAIFIAAVAYVVDMLIGAGLRHYSKITGVTRTA
jgi:ABC-type nitrate/sulfonate/bicarbonate transport system permease component